MKTKYPITQCIHIKQESEKTLCSASAENKAGCNLFSAAKTFFSSMSRLSIVNEPVCRFSIFEWAARNSSKCEQMRLIDSL